MPIIERGRVQPVLADIVAAIDGHPLDERDDRTDHAVLRSYLAADGAIAADDGKADAALVAAVARLADHGASPSLFGGAARIGWAVAHLTSGEDADAVCDAIDRALLQALDGWTSDYDLISGLVGLGVYTLERGAAGEPIADAVVTGLERYMASGWVTPPELLIASQRAEMPDGYVNHGMAHGIPGAIAMLARFGRRGLAAERSRALLDHAVRRLLDGSPRRAHGRFPSWQPSAYAPSPRLAWCYDDLGVAAALVGAGIAADHAEARDEGLALALDCAQRSVAEAQVVDAAICHGAAGIAHMFNRMAQATGDAALREAAVRWLEHTLAMRNAHPLAGFPANRPTRGQGDGPDDSSRDRPHDRTMRLFADASLLTGACGVALVLHAASSEIEPEWDRLLLVDMPPAP